MNFPHIPNREALGAADNLEAFTPDRMVRSGLRKLTDEEVAEFRNELAIVRMVKALKEALADIRPDVRVEGNIAHYPNEAPQDLREIAKRTISLVTYHV